VPSRNEHLHQLDNGREKNQSSAVCQITIRITQTESQTRKKKYRRMFERSRETRDEAIISGNYGESHDAKDENPSPYLECIPHYQ
jgi:hypothetical protein